MGLSKQIERRETGKWLTVAKLQTLLLLLKADAVDFILIAQFK